MDNLKYMFPNIKYVKSDNAHKISPHIEHEWINVEDAASRTNVSGNDLFTDKKELDLLIEIIKKSMNERGSKSIIVFAESKKSIDKICEALRQAEIKSLPFYPDIAVQGRAMTLMLFQS